MPADKPNRAPKRVREQVVVYLEPRDRQLLEELAARTGLARSELLRQGLWQLGHLTLRENRPGSATDYLMTTAGDDGFPPDVAARHDRYLSGGGSEAWRGKQKKRKARNRRAGPR